MEFYEFVPGERCTLTNHGDLAMSGDAKQFIGQECVIVKITKAGLVQVRLISDSRRTYSAPKRNIEFLESH